MTKWEYRIIDSKEVESEGWLKGKSRRGAESYLNELGGEGWEIINIDWREVDSSRTSFSGVAKRQKE